MVIGHWPAWFRALYGSEWPNDYVTFDVETTGFSRKHDLIVEFGHCLVEGGKVVDQLNLVLDWTDHPVVPDQWLRNRLREVSYNMSRDGKHYTMSYDRMKKEGIRPPEKVLKFYLDLFNTLIQRDLPFVAHGGTFDEEMFSSSLVGFNVGDEFSFPDNRIFDTAAIEKANQLVGDVKVIPQEGETLRAYFKRIRYMKKGNAHSSLDMHCVPKYDLINKNSLDPKKLHTAGFDSFLVHLLMEEFRSGVTPEVLTAEKEFIANKSAMAVAAKPHTKAKIPDLLKGVKKKVKPSAPEETENLPLTVMPVVEQPVTQPVRLPWSARRRGQRNR